MKSKIKQAFDHLRDNSPGTHDTVEAQVAATRAFVEQYGGKPVDAVASQAFTLETVNTSCVQGQWLVPRNPSLERRIVYLHGGAWIAGSMTSYRAVAVELAQLAQCPVFLVDYRLAPEHPFPAGLEDCIRAMEWAWRNGPTDHGPATSLGVVGDSAGGNLAAAACGRIAADGAPYMPSWLALLSPALDNTPRDAPDTPSDPIVNSAGIAGVMMLYTQSSVPLSDARVSPLLTSDEALRCFPQTLLQASSAEYLYPDAKRLFQRLCDNQVPATLSVWPDLPHYWQSFLTLLPQARDALQEIAAFGQRAA